MGIILILINKNKNRINFLEFDKKSRDFFKLMILSKSVIRYNPFNFTFKSNKSKKAMAEATIFSFIYNSIIKIKLTFNYTLGDYHRNYSNQL